VLATGLRARDVRGRTGQRARGLGTAGPATGGAAGVQRGLALGTRSFCGNGGPGSAQGFGAWVNPKTHPGRAFAGDLADSWEIGTRGARGDRGTMGGGGNGLPLFGWARPGGNKTDFPRGRLGAGGTTLGTTRHQPTLTPGSRSRGQVLTVWREGGGGPTDSAESRSRGADLQWIRAGSGGPASEEGPGPGCKPFGAVAGRE